MKIQIYCNKCNKLEIVEKAVQKDQQQGDSPTAIPIPGVKNGLTTYSLVHQDHTLIVDVDAEGNVRGERTIQRIDQQIETVLAATAQRILTYIEHFHNQQISFVILTDNERFRKMILGLFQQLIFNISPNLNGLLSITKGESLLEFGPLTVFVGSADTIKFDRVYSLLSETTTFVYLIDTKTVINIADLVNKNFSERPDANFAILTEPSFMKSELGKEFIKELILQIPGLQILDAENPEKIAMAMFSIVDILISEKIAKIAKKILKA